MTRRRVVVVGLPASVVVRRTCPIFLTRTRSRATPAALVFARNALRRTVAPRTGLPLWLTTTRSVVRRAAVIRRVETLTSSGVVHRASANRRSLWASGGRDSFRRQAIARVRLPERRAQRLLADVSGTRGGVAGPRADYRNRTPRTRCRERALAPLVVEEPQGHRRSRIRGTRRRWPGARQSQGDMS